MVNLSCCNFAFIVLVVLFTVLYIAILMAEYEKREKSRKEIRMFSTD